MNVPIEGTYFLSNLLQELTLAKSKGLENTSISGSAIVENPVDRISRRIKDAFWDALTRKLDGQSILAAIEDSKTDSPSRRIYVPFAAADQYDYYKAFALEHPDSKLDIVQLPAISSDVAPAEHIRGKPGLLALQMDFSKKSPVGMRYVVPGGRFNELYGWDTYFCALGLLTDGKPEIAQEIVQNFIFEIEHYGCILNANRSYYLGRSQPPFLTDLVLRTFRQMCPGPEADEFLRRGILAAIKEYHKVWTSAPRLDPATELSRYRPIGWGIPPEVEEGHFDWILNGFAKKHDMSIRHFIDAYNQKQVSEPELDLFLLHDRGVRESGHDTT